MTQHPPTTPSHPLQQIETQGWVRGSGSLPAPRTATDRFWDDSDPKPKQRNLLAAKGEKQYTVLCCCVAPSFCQKRPEPFCQEQSHPAWTSKRPETCYIYRSRFEKLQDNLLTASNFIGMVVRCRPGLLFSCTGRAAFNAKRTTKHFKKSPIRRSCPELDWSCLLRLWASPHIMLSEKCIMALWIENRPGFVYFPTKITFDETRCYRAKNRLLHFPLIKHQATTTFTANRFPNALAKNGFRLKSNQPQFTKGKGKLNLSPNPWSNCTETQKHTSSWLTCLWATVNVFTSKHLFLDVAYNEDNVLEKYQNPGIPNSGTGRP